jgi:hypothetical protein
MPRARRSRGVTSAIKACAVEMVAPGHARPDPGDEQPDEALVRHGCGEEGIADRRARQADQQHGPAADAIGKAAPEWRKEELHQRERDCQRRHHERDEARRHLLGDPLGVDRQQRQHHPESQEVDEDD